MRYINASTGERIGTIVAEFHIPATTKVDTLYRFEVQHVDTGKVYFTKTNVTYKEVVALRATAHTVWSNIECHYDRACPECGYWMFTFGDTTLCMNDPECTYSREEVEYQL